MSQTPCTTHHYIILYAIIIMTILHKIEITIIIIIQIE